ncbi:hypothetical protein I5H08_gp028 [Mycobacterium phage Yuna]|uniref:Uncharacterized protein n=1 Tax=Mycobacterium phage Yuna TaxID=2599885 RepID=A0A5J6TI96_9CAUD|nr:hypothetical protein I5H08_gp028 [Mycobacterium phage Yuna]QFG09459.1 hypothetical protein PBI_YUNA_77 [Mycobacterium phage Yuna]
MHETWFSPGGTPFTGPSRQNVDRDQLAELYAAETSPDSSQFNALYNAANNSTLLAWSLGYRNPRVPGRIAECDALA